MYLSRYKITKEKDNFLVYDKKKKEIIKLPLKISELSIEERKKLKRTMLGSKIVSFLFPGIVLLAHQLYGRRLIAVILFSVISVIGGGPNPLIIPIAIIRGTYLSINLETITYENGSYYAIRSIIQIRNK